MMRAISHVVLQSEGEWVGWPGLALQKGHPVPSAEPGESSPTAQLTSQTVPVYLSQSDRDLAYTGCCKSSIWPLFHSMADRAVFNDEHWEAYKKLNQTFAEATILALRRALATNPDQVPLIWIHDYHLMIAANTIRAMAKEDNLPCKIGFFMHCPFPPYDMVKIFPWKDIVLQGILGSDLVGFQCEDYCLNFIECCARGLKTRVDRNAKLVEHDAGGRTVKVRALPVSIPFDRFVSMAETAEKSKLNVQPGTKIILSVDTVDYTKGLVYRLNAFERLLDKYHVHQGNVVMVQVVQPGRTEEYHQLKETLDNLVHQINSRFSTPTWIPVHYIQRPVTDEELAGLNRDADVALVTPLRDGMNLSGKEFVACRINPQNPGVVILSPFVGAADLMQEALMANPYESGRVADVIHNALTMDKAEAEVRMSALRDRESVHDLDHWLKTFLKEIGNLVDEGDAPLPTEMEKFRHEDFDDVLKKYMGESGWSNLCLLMDYDGNLAPCGPHPDLTILPPATKAVLERLSKMPNVFVAVITGRCIPDIKEKVGIPGITYAGNHGLDIVHPDGTKFILPMPEEVEEKVKWLLQRLQAECCHDGSWVENKGVVLAFHHEAWKEKGSVDPKKKEESLARARALIQEAGFKLGMSDGGLVTEAKPPVKWNKGNAAIYILRTAFGVHWSDRIRIIYSGDDLTDEDAMQALKGMAFSFRVCNSGMVQTCADHRLPDTKGVLAMLNWVEKFMLERRNKV